MGGEYSHSPAAVLLLRTNCFQVLFVRERVARGATTGQGESGFGLAEKDEAIVPAAIRRPVAADRTSTRLPLIFSEQGFCQPGALPQPTTCGYSLIHVVRKAFRGSLGAPYRRRQTTRIEVPLVSCSTQHAKYGNVRRSVSIYSK